jgi:hypothetical protein
MRRINQLGLILFQIAVIKIWSSFSTIKFQIPQSRAKRKNPPQMPIVSATLAFSCCSGYDRFFIISYNETKSCGSVHSRSLHLCCALKLTEEGASGTKEKMGLH